MVDIGHCCQTMRWRLATNSSQELRCTTRARWRAQWVRQHDFQREPGRTALSGLASGAGAGNVFTCPTRQDVSLGIQALFERLHPLNKERQETGRIESYNRPCVWLAAIAQHKISHRKAHR